MKGARGRSRHSGDVPVLARGGSAGRMLFTVFVGLLRLVLGLFWFVWLVACACAAPAIARTTDSAIAVSFIVVSPFSLRFQSAITAAAEKCGRKLIELWHIQVGALDVVEKAPRIPGAFSTDLETSAVRTGSSSRRGLMRSRCCSTRQAEASATGAKNINS